MLDVTGLNFHHLLYFWLVIREGGIVPAAKVLRLSHPTVSTQIHALEERLGETLLTKAGRKLVPTEVGSVVFRYADEIFTLGGEMLGTVQGRGTDKPLRLNVGIVDILHKLVVRRLLEPALQLAPRARLVCFEGTYERLLGELANHTLDLVIADAPIPPGSSVRAFNHLLGESGVTLFGTDALAKQVRRRFPRSLEGAPMLLPLEGSSQRRALNQWLDRRGLHPDVVGEFADSALLKVFGSAGFGMFMAPTVVEREVMEQYGVRAIGHLDGVRERFYAVSIERRLKHPGVLAISTAAREDLFTAG